MSRFTILVISVTYLSTFQSGISENNNKEHVISATTSTTGVVAEAAPTDLHVSDDSVRGNDLFVEFEAAETDTASVPMPSTSDTEPPLTIVELYAQGIRAYDQQLWYLCAGNIEKAVKGYRQYKNALSTCRLDCNSGARTSHLSNLSFSFHDFSHLTKLLRDADCFRRCRDETLISRLMLSEQVEDVFDRRAPYQYLQFCYFKLGRLKQAASAAYTYLLANPDDVDTRNNIGYYRDKALVPDADFVDLELVPYKEHYIRAIAAYKNQDWKSVISELEDCLKEYFKEYDGCLLNCAGKVKPKETEFVTEVADMFISVLFCKMNCEETLSTVYTEPISRFLQDIYHYLQFAYYQEGDLKKSAEITASFLVLNSSHAVMKENKNVLKIYLEYSDADFVPREDVRRYSSMQREMQGLMDSLTKHYRWPGDNSVADEESHKAEETVGQEEPDDWMTKYEKLGVHIIAKSPDLHREGRFVTDGMLKGDQCEELLTLTNDLPTEKVGSQVFDFKTAQKRLKENPSEEYEATLRHFIRATDIVRQYTQRYIGAAKTLYLQNAFILCWSQPQYAEDTHNCYTQEQGTCVRFNEMPAELDSNAFTTVTGLSNAHGDFQFLNEWQQIDSSLGVKCGRTVGFYKGDRHTVKVPQNQDDKMCSLVIRFTTSQRDVEKDYQETLALIRGVDMLRFAKEMKKGVNVMKKFADEGVQIVKNGEELMGKERFVADGLASEAQCTTLRNMVQIMTAVHVESSHDSAKPNFVSSLTEHEKYEGITIYRATKLTSRGKISTFGLRTFLELSENSRLLVERYFNLSRPLFFDFTHLVCRTALDDSKVNREDLSHPVHADNCILQADGSCTKDFPAFIHRDYSAILYLNADFEGGEFFFAHANKTEQVSLRPKCGRLVGFNAGAYHGVKAVKRGQRCALALWFTLDPSYKELAHVQARQMLKRFEEDQKAEQERVHEDL